MITVRCKECGKEISTNTGKTISCGCPNMATLNGDRLTAVDLNKVVMVRSNEEKGSTGFTSQDLQWQEERRKRKVRKLDFEIR
jgi:phage FluMu protein Com